MTHAHGHDGCNTHHGAGKPGEAPRSIVCRECIDFIIDYLEGDLAADARRVFEKHLALCRECREYLDSYRTTVRMAQSSQDAAEQKSGASMPENLVQAILDARRRGSS